MIASLVVGLSLTGSGSYPYNRAREQLQLIATSLRPPSGLDSFVVFQGARPLRKSN
jgi:hypothetical protein